MNPDQLDQRIAAARVDLDGKLDELQRRIRAASEKLSIDDLLGNNPWVRLGVSTAVGFVAGLAGRRLVRTGFRLALAMSAKRIARYAFEAAFDAGQRDGLRSIAGVEPAMATAQAADRSY